jgi:hypothetical protein
MVLIAMKKKCVGQNQRMDVLFREDKKTRWYMKRDFKEDRFENTRLFEV